MSSAANILNLPAGVNLDAEKLKPYSRFRFVKRIDGQNYTGETMSTREFESLLQTQIGNLVAVEGYLAHRPYGDHWETIR